jgi:hypothetical protein
MNYGENTMREVDSDLSAQCGLIKGWVSVWLLSVSIAASLVFIAPGVMADEQKKNVKGVKWGEWKSLDKGFMGRKKELVIDEVAIQNTSSDPADYYDGAVNALWLRTGAEGLYRASITDLATGFGIPAIEMLGHANNNELVLTNAGEPVSWFYDQQTNSIIFAAEAYDTFYADQNAYHLRVSPDGSAAAISPDKKPRSGSGEATPFIDTLKFEEEPDDYYFPWYTLTPEPDADYWAWDFLWASFVPPLNIPVNLPDSALSGPSDFRIKLRGFWGDSHNVRAWLNNFGEEGAVELGSVSWTGRGETVLRPHEGVNIQDYLDPSGDNMLVLEAFGYSGGSPNGEWLDQMEFDYTRSPVADNNQLWLHNVGNGIQLVTGLAGSDVNDFLVLESPAGEAVLRNDVLVEPDGAGYKATFKTKNGKDYLVAGRSAVNEASVEIDVPSDLTSSGSYADYLVISPRTFSATANALANYRQNRFAVRIAWLEDIYDVFAHGRVDPFAITRFIEHAGQSWLSPSAHIVLIGNASLDHKNRMGVNDSFIPTVMTDTPWGLIPSDDRLLGGNGDSPYAIGRIPISYDIEGFNDDPAGVPGYVNKLISHEASSPGPELFKAVLVADRPDPDAGDFHENTDLLGARLIDSLGFDTVEGLYHSPTAKKVFDSTGVTTFPIGSVRGVLTQSATWEAGYVSYDGHGSYTYIGDNFFTDADVGGLDNAGLLKDNRLPIFTALTCVAGDYSVIGQRSLAGALIFHPDGGAIASMSPTGLSLDADAQYLGNVFVDSLFSGNTIGVAVKDAKMLSEGYINNFMRRIYSVVGDPAVYAR